MFNLKNKSTLLLLFCASTLLAFFPEKPANSNTQYESGFYSRIGMNPPGIVYVWPNPWDGGKTDVWCDLPDHNMFARHHTKVPLHEVRRLESVTEKAAYWSQPCGDDIISGYPTHAASRKSIVRFPLTLNSGQETVGSHWYMETNATVSNTGRLDAVTKTKSCQTKGFTGSVWIALLDKPTVSGANILYTSPPQSYGINGKDPFGGCKDRAAPWSYNLPEDVVSKVRGIVIHHAPNPISRVTKEDVYEAIQKGAEIYQASQAGQ